jgi:hypothetical protein
MNTKTQHTTGPWRLAQYGVEEPAFTVMRGDKAVASVSCPRINGHRHKRIPSQHESEANARLIAAAPDLLAAIEHVLIASEDNGDMNDIDWQMLRSALAKAKGAAS